MPFIAIRDDGQGRVYIGGFDNPRAALEGVGLVCQDCGAPMIIRSGDIVRAHFAHRPGYEDRPCWYRTTGETDAHRSAKQSIAAALRRAPAYQGALIEVEYPVTTPRGRRYIDVFMELPDGRRFAHEAQLAAQSISQFDERTTAYRTAGLIPVWWLGQEADTNENRRWCESQCDLVGRIEIEMYRPVLISEEYDREGRVIRGNGRG